MNPDQDRDAFGGCVIFVLIALCGSFITRSIKLEIRVNSMPVAIAPVVTR